MDLFISAVVCTYNHSKLLNGCIESLCQQTLDKSKYEVIIVDNNSKDDTVEVVEAFIDLGNVRYVLEKNPGLSHARNRGTIESLGTYIAFIDDDAEAAPDWLEVAYNLLNSIRPALDCLGGPYHPLYLTPKPKWFLDKYEIRGFGKSQKYLNENEMLSGSNMIWAKESLNSIGKFNVLYGVVGNQLKLGEETDAFQKLWTLMKKPKIYFSPDLIIYHLVPEFKMTIKYRLKRKFVQGQYTAQNMITEAGKKKINDIIGSIFSILKSLIRFLFKITSHKMWQNWVVEDGGVVAYHAGRWLRYMGIEPKVVQRN